MTKRKYQHQTQFAALPCRLTQDGTREVMLLTSRGTGRWIIPKGWPIRGLKPREVATREAYEEAGLRGRLSGKKPVGTFHYAKQIDTDPLLCEVHVYLMWVEEQLDDWPEKSERQTRWFGVPEAAGMVDEGGLSEIILRLSRSG
jgi:8-oxo-dGTP pyrophosphatase MutT (NUDIX family)